jgi:tetratricopeptide (TPR) repeat protein
VAGIREHRLAICVALFLAGCSLQVWSQSERRQAAVSLEQQGKTSEAEVEWKAISKEQPSNPEPFAHLGLLEARQELYAEAIKMYRKAYALAPGMPGLRLNLGLSLFKNGDYRQAIEIFEPMQKAEPDDQRLNVLLGMSHYGLAQYATASPYLKRAADEDPKNLTLLLTLAHSCLLSQKYPCVLDAFHQIVGLNAESAEADMLVGEALDQMKDRVGAIREFRAAVKANPREPNVHFGLGYLLWTNGEYPDAAKEFQAELANDPQHIQAMLYLADAQMQMSQMDEAAPLLEKLVTLSPENAMAHLDLGIVYVDQGHKTEALAQLKRSIRLVPNNVNAHWRLGRLYRSMGMTVEAKAEFDTASSLNKTEDDRLLKVMSTIPAGDRTTSPRPGASTPK